MSRTQQTKRVLKKLGGIALSSYVPGFFRIHARYISNYPIVWAALFVAPFIAIKMALANVFGWFGAEAVTGLGFDILAIIALAACFFAAERSPEFRRYYIYLAPAIIFISLIYWAWGEMGLFTPPFLVVGALIWLLTMAVLKITRTKGELALAHGGNRKYAKARRLYNSGDYKAAAPLLEKVVKRGHFKVLNLMGECYELGRGFERDPGTAARYYLRAAKKGYRPAYESFSRVYEELDEDARENIENNLLGNWLEN